jgi:hypothetical protein
MWVCYTVGCVVGSQFAGGGMVFRPLGRGGLW